MRMRRMFRASRFSSPSRLLLNSRIMDAVADEPRAENTMWSRTRRAVAQFRQLLLCSKCSRLMSDPVYLGTCEHMFCRSCAGPCAGAGCIVCHSPAWVKDLQINRQLSNITQLFCQLEALLNPQQMSCSPSVEASPKSARGGAANPRKNFKVWFSPRSRRIRCRVAKAEGTTPQGLNAKKRILFPKQTQDVSRPKDLSVFSFSSSSQDSTPSHCRDANAKKDKTTRRVMKKKSVGQKHSTTKQTRTAVRKKKLEAINRQWGISQGVDTTGEGGERINQKVSFQSPGKCPASLLGSDLQQGVDQETPASLMGGRTDQHKKVDPSVGEDLGLLEETPPKEHSPTAAKRTRPQDPPDTQSTPKLPRGSLGAKKQAKGVPLATPIQEQPGAVASPRTPTVLKRNHKGETLLHLAAIKGDVTAVTELLEQGADPNLKDHAGWTPLHEACNLGHLAVAEVLLQGGALLNAPGYQNDSPLHDAVRNGHVDIVRLLLEKGASQSVLNTFGLRPVDCAETEEIRAILRAAADCPDAPLSSPGAVCKSRRGGPVTLLGSRLSLMQQNQLTQLARLLGGRNAGCFSRSVTHVIVPDNTMPTTMSCFHGILNGCWIVSFDWVRVCLKAERWTGESEYEVGDAPTRSRINQDNLLPPLFDGCFFFFLGSFRSPSKTELLELVKDGGGQVLARRPKPDSDVTQTVTVAAYHAPAGSDQALCTQYVLYDPQGHYKPARVRLGKVWSAPSTWLLDCIAAFQLLPVPEPSAGSTA
ncbi:BRCA1-associated RING domain protein 1 [Arapaima gigas]